MNLFRRFADRISLFFHDDLPFFFDQQPFIIKAFLIILALLAAYPLFILLFIGIALVFVLIMSSLTDEQTYELLHPVEEIAYVEIIHIEEEIFLYNYSVDSIAGILDEQTTVQTQLVPSQTRECIEDLYQVPASKWWNDPSPSIVDGTIRIVYRDGSREWICSCGTFYFDSGPGDASMTWYYFSDEDFSPLLEKYGYQKPR